MHRLSLSPGGSRLEASELNALRENSIKTVADFICCDVDRVAHKISFPAKDLCLLQKSFITQLSALTVNGSDVYEELMSRFCILSTGCDHLDELLDGGLYTGELTEFVGAAGVGKSQVCMSIAIFTAKETRKDVLYVDTGGSLSGIRLKEMLMEWDCSLEDEEMYSILSRISVVQAFDIHSVFDTLESVRERLNNEEDDECQHLRLIIVDSVAGVIGPILGGQQILGHSLMVNLSRTLKSLAVDHSLAVMVTNNVVSDAKSSSSTKPALGPSWVHVPNTRVFIQKSPTSHQSGGACGAAGERIGTVTKSSRQKLQVSSAFYIGRGGLYSVKKPVVTRHEN